MRHFFFFGRPLGAACFQTKTPGDAAGPWIVSMGSVAYDVLPSRLLLQFRQITKIKKWPDSFRIHAMPQSATHRQLLSKVLHELGTTFAHGSAVVRTILEFFNMTLYTNIDFEMLSQNDRKGFIIRCLNNSTSTKHVSVPHRRETVFLSRAGVELPKEYYPMRWDKMEPIVLSAGECKYLSIDLVPYWLDLADKVIVTCKFEIEGRGRDSQYSECQAEIEVNLPSRDATRQSNLVRKQQGDLQLPPTQALVDPQYD